jgi:flagellar protein FliS
MSQTIAISTIERLLEASPSQLVVMLYDEALKNLETAIAAVETGEIEKRCIAVNRAIEIVSHLYLTLDAEQGGEIAEKLGAIYAFVLTRLPRVNLRNDAEAAHEVIRLLQPMRESWRELDLRIEASVAASMASMGAQAALGA